MKILSCNSTRGQTSRQKKTTCYAVLSFLFLICSCQPDLSPRPSVLILAIENYGIETSLCDWESNPQVQKKLDYFCKNAQILRGVQSNTQFSVPALAPLLFGLSRKQLGLQTDSNFVPAQFESFAEKFYGLDYQTAFFASTPIFQRQTGLAQGFAVFDESLTVEKDHWGRNSQKVIQAFLKWKKEIQGPYYSVLTLSDLKFPWVETTSLTGQLRPRGQEAQAEALEESIAQLIEKLKDDEKNWNNLWLFVIGLQGDSRNETQETHQRQVYAAIMPPSKQKKIDLLPAQLSEAPLELFQVSQLIHQQILNGDATSLDKNYFNSTIEDKVDLHSKSKTTSEEYWLKNDKTSSQKRIQSLLQQKNLTPDSHWWILLEYIRNKRFEEAEKMAQNTLFKSDLEAFRERLQFSERKTSFQDTCLRMIDLRIFEGGGIKKCDSEVLLSLREWIRFEELGIDSPDQNTKIKELRQKTLRLWQDLRQQEMALLINKSLGDPLQLNQVAFFEILRVEMALSLPSVKSQFIWLEKHRDYFSN